MGIFFTIQPPLNDFIKIELYFKQPTISIARVYFKNFHSKLGVFNVVSCYTLFCRHQ